MKNILAIDFNKKQYNLIKRQIVTIFYNVECNELSSF